MSFPPFVFRSALPTLRSALCALLSALCLTSAAQAQWQSTNYTLKGGWNAIYLHGEATFAPPATLFSANPEVLEVWRWNPNPNQVQFTTSPLLPTPGTPEWTVWKRDGSVTALTGLTGQNAYLVRCSGTTANTYTVTLPQRPLPPSTKWVRNGANLLGFPTKLNGSYPTFQNYFTAFPAAIAANVKIFKYTGGELSAANPLQIFSPNAERLDRNQAYWFDSEVVGNFSAPLEISLSVSGGLDFGRNGSIITARVLNRTAAVMSLTIAPVASNAAPSGQETITGSVPVTRRTFNSTTAAWEETPIATGYTEVIAPQSSVELSFGIDRAAMTAGTPGALFASLLRLTDGGDQFDILLPVQARKTSLAGLWIGEATVNAVESKADADAVTPTGRGYPLRYVIHVADDGTARVLSQVFMGPMAAAPHDFGICTKEIGLKSDRKADASRIVSVHLPLNRVLDGAVDPLDPLEAAGSGSVAMGVDLIRTVRIPFNDPTNPFVHQYHPDHDNKSAAGVALMAGQESYNIERRITFSFTATPPPGSSVTTGWGSSVIGGTYAETVQGLHKDTTGVGTGNGLNLIGTFELRRASELGSLTVN
jgi:hypothetical protein